MVTSRWVNSKGSYYYIGIDGIMKSNELLFLEDNKQYFLKKSGAMATDEVIKLNSGYFYFQKDGVRLKTVSMFTCKGKTYISDGQGRLYQNQIVKYQGVTYETGDDASIIGTK